MEQNQNAKERIVEAFDALMLEQPFESISVTQVCRQARVSRKTFYNHFKDKHDVVGNIFISDILSTVYDLQKYGFGGTEILTKMYQRFLLKKEFYRNAIQTEGQDLHGGYYDP